MGGQSGQPAHPPADGWLAGVAPDLTDKLARVGLIAAPAEQAAVTLAEFLDSYIAGREDVKERTRSNFKQARDFLVRRFGERRPLDSITAGEADEWRLWLMSPAGGNLSENTVRRHCGRAKQFFRAAHRRQLIPENPFGDMKGCDVRANRARDYFVTRREVALVLEACPDAEWRLIVALARYGGLRTPSELLALRWCDVDWSRRRMLVRSPKTEHHAGKDSRLVPLFPERKPHFEAARDAAAVGAEYVITRYRDASQNLRTQLERIIHRAGLQPWPKLFQNLRASRATELAAEYPSHVAAEWLGHSRLVAANHYWRVTDADFERATRGPDEAAQNPAQQPHADDCKPSQVTRPVREENPDFPRFATPRDIVQTCTVPRTGFEPVTPGLGNRCSIL